MVLKSRREIQEEFQKITLKIDILNNNMMNGILCSSCYVKYMRKENAKLRILVSIILSMYII